MPETSKNYPDLPNISRTVPRVQPMIRSANDYNPIQSTPAQAVPSAPLLVQENNHSSSSVTAEASLVNELLQENTRLQEEVNRLKSMLAAPSHHQVPV